MSRDDRYCPDCDALFKWYENTCPTCGAELVDAEPDVRPQPEADPLPEEDLVPVFESDAAGDADLARLALEQEGIECAVTGPSPFLNSTGGTSTVFVPVRHADRARELLADLQDEVAPSRAPVDVASPVASASAGLGLATIHLRDAERGQFIGRIDESQLDFLCGRLEEDAEAPQTYYIDAATIDMLADQGAGTALVELLRGALGGREGVEIRWSDESGDSGR